MILLVYCAFSLNSNIGEIDVSMAMRSLCFLNMIEQRVLIETPLILMGQWKNLNIRHTVTDGPFLRANMSKCTFNPKKKIHTGLH